MARVGLRIRDHVSMVLDIAAGTALRNTPGGISLVLHNVGYTGGRDSISLDQFLAWFTALAKDRNFVFVGAPWPPPPHEKWLHLCFDDAYEDALKLGPPVLADRSIPFSFAVCAAMIGGAATWQGGIGAKLADEVLIKETLSMGGELLSHGVSHENLRTLSHSEFSAVVRQSKESLEQQFAYQVSGFVFPYGHASSFARQALKDSGYAFGLTAVPGVINRNSDPYLLPRCGLSKQMSTRQVMSIARGGSRWRAIYLRRHFINS